MVSGYLIDNPHFIINKKTPRGPFLDFDEFSLFQNM
jgi:hypothetical protein